MLVLEDSRFFGFGLLNDQCLWWYPGFLKRVCAQEMPVVSESTECMGFSGTAALCGALCPELVMMLVSLSPASLFIEKH